MGLHSRDMYAAMMHELKNNLGLLTMTLDAIPLRGEADHDRRLDNARLLCQRSIERLQQALLIYKAENRELHPVVDAYAPVDIVQELHDSARSLARGRLVVQTRIDESVPQLAFFDRSLVLMALTNAVHNSLTHARARVNIEVAWEEGFLVFSVRDDSAGYPAHILADGQSGGYTGNATGLGLKFARLIAEAHENRGRVGELRLFNDNGAVFRLMLP